MDELDERLLGEITLRVWKYKEGELVTLMMHLGHELGLYSALTGTGAVTAADLAAASGCDDRWVLEWLRCQAAAGLVESDDGVTFELSPEAGAVLASADRPTFASGALVAPLGGERIEAITEAIRTGRGFGYGEMGRDTAVSVEASFAPWARAMLVPQVVPAIAGLGPRLDAGARVVDVGCGSGLMIELLAASFPLASYSGYDPSAHAIELARTRLATTERVSLVEAPAAALPAEPTFDVALAFDCLHDMPQPADALAAIRRSLVDDGVLVVKEIRSTGSFAA
ncbi:MAG: class I SAM-dependent methyltransferase, partial [Acidimicrobiia bacterium]|nr:class I SAM-dependent methyltransferase [Acidimicrobiia bacterium]